MVSTRSSAAATTAANSKSNQGGPSQSVPRPSTAKGGSSKFPYTLPYVQLCLRTHPYLYRTGVGEQGVLMVEPYKSELLPHWKFKDPAAATASSRNLHRIFLSYLSEDDFVGADLARKFIQMGYTRARRYANHKGGKKYVYEHDGANKGKRREIARLEVQDQDPAKVEAARIFKQVLDEQVWTNARYTKLREDHIEWAKTSPVLTEESREVQAAILKDPKKQRVVRKCPDRHTDHNNNEKNKQERKMADATIPTATANDAVDKTTIPATASASEGHELKESASDVKQDGPDNADEEDAAEAQDDDDEDDEDEDEDEDEDSSGEDSAAGGGDVGLSYLLEDHSDEESEDEDFHESQDEDDEDDDPEIQESDEEDSTPASSSAKRKRDPAAGPGNGISKRSK
ncbi:hypothetical protein EX895_006525 [Sporisorium graminicola]|uniref:DUF4385 domain containing protein n=1 Tax=Sporisorium graminicola TaxID=280036 RepID=A0A4U7KL42_9BASI|nr:hypothetical protein EX895_006525 [Sporisorium graminicola]TKY84623.1 hypothetical protein EX895_006525 [Sporisorium graminicola]